MTWVDDHVLADQRRAGVPQQGGLLPEQLWSAADNLAAELSERAHGAGAEAAVRQQANLALELLQRSLGAGAEDTVRAAHVVAHLDEPLLQRFHVVAGHRLGD